MTLAEVLQTIKNRSERPTYKDIYKFLSGLSKDIIKKIISEEDFIKLE